MHEYQSYLTDEGTARLLARHYGEHGFGVLCRPQQSGTVLTSIFAPSDGEDPLPWGMSPRQAEEQARLLFERK